MNDRRILFLCPDYDQPSGGIRALYRHVDFLHESGFAAAIVHQQPGFRCTWFVNLTPVEYLTHLVGTARDLIVIPEIYGPQLARLFPGVPKVVFNQNCYLTFQGYDLTIENLETPYTHPDIKAVLTVSQDNLAYLRYAFPNLIVARIHYGIDASLFAGGEPKERLLGYMPRKNVGDVVQVLNILKQRRVLGDFRFAPIEGCNEQQTAAILRRSAIFLSFGYPEGCPLPPLEAMASGCAVIGYHGNGGREYFRPEFCWPIEVGDIVGFALAAESVIQLYTQDRATILTRTQRAAAFVRSEYSLQREKSEVVQFWQSVLTETVV